MSEISWTLKDVSTLSGAVTNMRHSWKVFSRYQEVSLAEKVQIHRKLKPILAELKHLASDGYYFQHGLADYDAFCEANFEFAKRAGYGILRLKDSTSVTPQAVKGSGGKE